MVPYLFPIGYLQVGCQFFPTKFRSCMPQELHSLSTYCLQQYYISQDFFVLTLCGRGVGCLHFSGVPLCCYMPHKIFGPFCIGLESLYDGFLHLLLRSCPMKIKKWIVPNSEPNSSLRDYTVANRSFPPLLATVVIGQKIVVHLFSLWYNGPY